MGTRHLERDGGGNHSVACRASRVVVGAGVAAIGAVPLRSATHDVATLLLLFNTSVGSAAPTASGKAAARGSTERGDVDLGSDVR